LEDEEDLDGLEVPERFGSKLLLNLNKARGDPILDLDSDKENMLESSSPVNNLSQTEASEEDWPDVQFPSNGKLTLATTLAKVTLPEKVATEEFSDLEVPSNGLTLKSPHGKQEVDEDEFQDQEDDWFDVDLPDNFIAKLHNLNKERRNSIERDQSFSIIKQNLY